MVLKVSSSSQPIVLLEEYIKISPPGFHFCPKDNELLDYILKKKNSDPIADIIREVNIYDYNPKQLQRKFNNGKGNVLYLFTTTAPLKGSKTNRKAGNGWWRNINKHTEITEGGKTIGYKKTLRFVSMKEGKEKTSWYMHEYSLPLAGSVGNGKRKMMDRFVLCRIYKSRSSKTCEVPSDENTSMASMADGEFDIDSSSSHSSQCPTTVPNDSEQMFDSSSTENFKKKLREIERLLMDDD